MTELSAVGEITEPISQEARSFIEASIRALQEARLDKRNTATLGDLFRDRNPYFLRSTRKAAFDLVSDCLDSYLVSVDEKLFADFERELSAFAARRGQRMLEPAAVLELFARDDLPLRIELLEEYDRLYNRLSHRFFEEFCDGEGRVDWVRLTRHLIECEA